MNKLYFGDCIDIMKTIEGQSIDFILTDLPYGVTNCKKEFDSIANRKEMLHPTQKPLDLIEYLIQTYTLENETVLDFTMGSGTTGVACKNLSRNFIGIENNKEYFEIAENQINGAN